MRPFQYRATLIPENAGAFTVRFADLPEAITSGINRSDALVQAADCLDEAIAGRIADGLDIPMPSAARRNQPRITLPAPTAAKAALYMAMKESKIKNTELARMLGCDEKEVRRMLDPRHQTKLPRIQRALDVLGKRLVVSMEEKAA
jgi:antitoxin HicB